MPVVFAIIWQLFLFELTDFSSKLIDFRGCFLFERLCSDKKSVWSEIFFIEGRPMYQNQKKMGKWETQSIQDNSHFINTDSISKWKAEQSKNTKKKVFNFKSIKEILKVKIPIKYSLCNLIAARYPRKNDEIYTREKYIVTEMYFM